MKAELGPPDVMTVGCECFLCEECEEPGACCAGWLSARFVRLLIKLKAWFCYCCCCCWTL